MIQPRVSVLLPVRNGGRDLLMAVWSVLEQSFQDWELLVLDDASTDRALAAITKVSDSRVRAVQDATHRGLAARLNQGLELARGEYIARMDHDDIAFPSRLQSQVEYLDAHRDTDLLGTRALVFDGSGAPAGLFPYRRTHEEICRRPWLGFYLPHPTWMGRADWFRRHKYRIPEPRRAEDQDLLLRSYAFSRFACLPEVLLGYRVGSSSQGLGIVLGDGSIAGIDTDRFRPNAAIRAAIRAELGVKDADVLLLFLGRLVRDKGVLDLAAAFALAHGRNPDLALVFVGPDEQGITADIRSAAGAADGRVRFVGYTQRPEEYLAASDAVCLPSYREGFSTVTLEAGACEVPALASRIYGTEGSIVDGETGRYLPAADPQAWANAIVEIASDPVRRSRWGKAARAHVLERFRAERVVMEMQKFYEHALAPRNVGG